MMDGPAPGGTYRIKITIRFKVRRSERFVEEKGPTNRFREQVYQKKNRFLSVDFSLNNFSLDRRDYRMSPSASSDSMKSKTLSPYSFSVPNDQAHLPWRR
jgi:hypothetical protein